MGRAHAAHALARLRERGRVLGVGVHDAAARERAVQLEVGGRVGGGAQVRVHDLAARQRDEHHVVRRHRLVRHAARLDRHEPGRAVDAGDVAERAHDEAAAREVQVRAVDRLAQRGVGPPGSAHARPAVSRSRTARSRFMSVPRSARGALQPAERVVQLAVHRVELVVHARRLLPRQEALLLERAHLLLRLLERRVPARRSTRGDRRRDRRAEGRRLRPSRRSASAGRGRRRRSA